MSTREAVDALKRLGLDNYEARVFVALQQLGGGTAQDVAKNSEVPRSQVYGTADGLAERGLVEVIEASPKEYRPVELETAREILGERIRREQERAFENLEAIRKERTGPTGGGVSTLRGRHPIDRRLASMIADAEEMVVFGFPSAEYLPESVAETLADRAAAGVPVTLVTEDRSVAETYAETDGVTVVVDPTGTTGYTGRILLVDDASILISVLMTEDDTEAVDEMALWTAETKIAQILGQFIYAGMERVLEESARE